MRLLSGPQRVRDAALQDAFLGDQPESVAKAGDEHTQEAEGARLARRSTIGLPTGLEGSLSVLLAGS
jgi:hypothetical protein